LKLKEKLLVFGAGGHAKVVVDIIERQGDFDIAAVLDDDVNLEGSRFFGYSVLGTRAELRGLQSAGLRLAIVAIGDNAGRAGVAAMLAAQGWQFASAIHPNACLSRGVDIAPGCVIMAGSVLNADARVGAHGIINSGATIDHDCRIAEGVHIAPGCHLCGGVRVGRGSFLGAGSTVTPGVNIGSNALVGAGSVVIRDVADAAQVSGVPDRPRD
jgi:sugar O-acyltransferase (sialic acid O-acetyltransferase NeuD family)